MNLMMWLKLKSMAGTGLALLLAGGAVAAAFTSAGGDGALTAREIATQVQEAYAALSSYTDTGTVTSEAGGVATETSFGIWMQRPGSCFVNWTQTTNGRYTSRGSVYSNLGKNLVVLATAGKRSTYGPLKARDRQEALAMSAPASALASATIPAMFFQPDKSEMLGVHAALKRDRDEKIGRVDCHVITSEWPEGKITLWIGKRDHLIHQARSFHGGATTETHEAIQLGGDLTAFFVN